MFIHRTQLVRSCQPKLLVGTVLLTLRNILLTLRECEKILLRQLKIFLSV